VSRTSAVALAQAFAEHGQVIDVGRLINGRDAIRDWAEREVIGGRYQLLEINALDKRRQTILLEFTPPDAAAGFRARYTFTYNEDYIVAADLQYA
jgi:hypothetical protein